MKKKINIVESFTLTHDDGQQQKFNAGQHEVEDHIADHWFVRAHSDEPAPLDPPVGTQEYAKIAARKLQRRRALDAAAEDASDEDEHKK